MPEAETEPTDDLGGLTTGDLIRFVERRSPGFRVQLIADRELVLVLDRQMDGIAVVDGDTVRLLHDSADPYILDALTDIQRAVLAARLRAWADRLANSGASS